VLVKSFYAQGKPFETRHLKLHNNGQWAGYSYQWNAAGTDARLVAEAGRTIQVEMTPGRSISWRLPGRGECMVCHTGAAAFALGPEIAQLNSFYTYPRAGIGHQLATWDHVGLFINPLPKPVKDLPALSPPWVANQSNILRARSHLHANCSGCHRPGVPSRATLDFRYATPVTSMNACNLPPRISNLGVAGAQLLRPGDPAASVVSLRMSRRGANQMPPLATTVVDEARLLIDGWIRRADVCAPQSDADGDGVTQQADNCTTIANASQWDSDRDRFGDACDGDLNNDLRTDAADRRLLTGALNAVLGNAAYNSAYDFNLDGRIDSLDVQYFDARLVNRPPGPSGLRSVP
jgi:mono/diheme cytochrome c family protein